MKVLLCSSSYGSLAGTLQSNDGPLPIGAIQLPWGSYWQMPVEPLGILRISSYLEENGYDIEWSNNESTLKENQDEKLNTPKEKIQETAQQSRGTAGVTDKGEASRSPDTNSELKEREIEVEG